MRRQIPILLLQSLALAIPVTVPVPLDGNGHAPALTKSAVMRDGTWLVSDSARRVWWSGDRGAHWDSVPRSRSGSWADLFGEQVVSSDENSMWSRSEGWVESSMPLECREGQERTVSGSGISGALKRDSSIVRYCRSTDGFRTWKHLLVVAAKDVPAGIGDSVGDFWNGRIWYPVVDSGYMRGTADGSGWMRVPVPAQLRFFRMNALTPDGTDLQLHGSTTKTGTMYAATSIDSGRNWQVYPMSEPGHIVKKITDRLFFSMSNSDTEGRRYWLSGASSGPWAAIDTSYRGILTAHDSVYVVGETSITLFDYRSVGVVMDPDARARIVHREAGGFSVRLPGASGSAWRLVSLDGRILASGRAMTESVAVPGFAVPTILGIAGRTVRLPPF